VGYTVIPTNYVLQCCQVIQS